MELQKFNSLVSFIQENGLKSHNPYNQNPTMEAYRLVNAQSEQIEEYKSIAKGNTNAFEFYINVHTRSQSKKVSSDDFVESDSCRIVSIKDGHGIDLLGDMFVLYKKVN